MPELPHVVYIDKISFQLSQGNQKGCKTAQSVEHRTLHVEVLGSNPGADNLVVGLYHILSNISLA